MTKLEVRQFMIAEMLDAGEIISRGDGEFYEDMGGHLLHESNLDGHIQNYLENMPREERNALLRRLNP